MRLRDNLLTRRRASALVALSAASLFGRRSHAGQPWAAEKHDKIVPIPHERRMTLGPPNKPVWLNLPPTPALPPSDRGGLIKVNGVEVFVARFGEGPAVLLLHGGLANSNYWGHQVDELAKKFMVIVMDTRGHGRSPLTSPAFGYAIFSDDVAALLDAFKLPSVAIVGWSDGAITGLQLAMRRPERVSKLFAFGANVSLDGLKKDGASSKVFVAYAQRCRAEYGQLSPNPEKWSQLIEGLRPMWRREPNFIKRDLAQIGALTAVSDGEYDEIITRAHTERIAREISGARLVIQPAVSHFAMLQNPDQFNRAVLDFLAV